MYVYDFINGAKTEYLKDNINKEWLRNMYEKRTLMVGYDLVRNGIYKCMGWCYVLRDDMNHYLYKQHGQWYEGYAPNRTLLRKNVYGRIDRIIDLRKAK